VARGRLVVQRSIHPAHARRVAHQSEACVTTVRHLDNVGRGVKIEIKISCLRSVCVAE
jgi:hypothetical protein